MEKRYQVFISSTFADLEEERKCVMEAVLDLDCFPAGMEMFPASDMEQFEYIKTIIDQSDYYVLIIAGRYGSIAEDGYSFTEKEYDYAKSKDIPILSFVKKDITSIPVLKTDEDPTKKEKLEKFREKALAGRLGKLWNDSKDLKYEISSSLSKEFRIKPRLGWIKGDIENNEILLRQINELRVENDNLKKEIDYYKTHELDNKNESYLEKHIDSLAQGDSKYEVNFEIEYYSYEAGNYVTLKDKIALTWSELFDEIGFIIISSDRRNMREIINNIIYDKVIEKFEIADNEPDDVKYFSINDKNMTVIILQLNSLNLLESLSGDYNDLTEKGRNTIINNLLEKKQ